LFHQPLLGAVVQHRDAGQRHQRQQRLLHGGLAAHGQPAVEVVVVDEAGQAPRVDAARVGIHHVLHAALQLGRRATAREHVHQARVEREVEHAAQALLPTFAADVALQLARVARLARRVDAKAFAEGEEVASPGAPCHHRHARSLGVGGVEEVFEELGRYVVRGVDAHGVHAHLAHPVAEAVAQRAAHARVLGVEVVQA
jgi:hypothetical protein